MVPACLFPVGQAGERSAVRRGRRRGADARPGQRDSHTLRQRLPVQSGEFRKATSVLGIRVEHIWASTPQQNGHVESFHNTLKRDYVHTRDFESFQDAAAWLAVARKDYNANRARSSIGWAPPDGFLRLRERNNRQEDGAR